MTKKHIDQLSFPNGFYVPTYPHKPNIPKGETHRPIGPPKWFLCAYTHTHTHTHTHTMCFFFEMTKQIILSLGHAKDAWSSPIGQISTMFKVCLELHYLLNR
jgi:hypothetical protein